MNRKEIRKYIHHSRITDDLTNEWIELENPSKKEIKELENLKFGIFFGDSRGDIILTKIKTMKELKKEFQNHQLKYGYGFDWEIFLIIKNGKKCNVSIKLT